MAEYIEREAALEIVEMYRWGKHLDRNSSLNAVRNGIDMIPAADVVPVVHGRWVWNMMAMQTDVPCMTCGNVLNVEKKREAKMCPLLTRGVTDAEQ